MTKVSYSHFIKYDQGKIFTFYWYFVRYLRGRRGHDLHKQLVIKTNISKTYLNMKYCCNSSIYQIFFMHADIFICDIDAEA